MKHKIIISALIVVLISVSFWLGFTIQENKRLAGELDNKKDKIAGLELNNGTKAISLGDKKDEIKELEEELIVKELTLIYAKDEIDNLVSYLEFMQNLCDVNGLTYPYYVGVVE